MEYLKSLSISAVIWISVCLSCYVSSVIAAPDRFDGSVESIRMLEQYARQNGIPEKDIARYMAEVMATLALRDRITFDRLRNSCGEDIQLFCSHTSTLPEAFECIKSNRDLVAPSCCLLYTSPSPRDS